MRPAPQPSRPAPQPRPETRPAPQPSRPAPQPQRQAPHENPHQDQPHG
jgi:hypothetical protein